MKIITTLERKTTFTEIKKSSFKQNSKRTFWWSWLSLKNGAYYSFTEHNIL